MVERIIETEHQRDLLIRLVQEQKLPFSATVTKGRKRSIEQNRLQILWVNEVADQLGDQTAEEVRGFCKLTMGVPILRAENPDFREKYDRIIRPHAYEDKLAMMMEPLDFPVTRLMKSGQKTRYLDEMCRFWSAKGMFLTDPRGRGIEQHEEAA